MNNKIFKWRFYNAIVSFCQDDKKFCESKMRPVLVIGFQGSNAIVLPISSVEKIHFFKLGLTNLGKEPKVSYIMNQIQFIDTKCFKKLHNKILSSDLKQEIFNFIISIFKKMLEKLVI